VARFRVGIQHSVGRLGQHSKHIRIEQGNRSEVSWAISDWGFRIADLKKVFSLFQSKIRNPKSAIESFWFVVAAAGRTPFAGWHLRTGEATDETTTEFGAGIVDESRVDIGR
jgi:hypothetical protein